MNLPKLSRDLITGIALVALLAVTRIGHFGGIAHHRTPRSPYSSCSVCGSPLHEARGRPACRRATDALAVAQGASSYCIAATS